MTSYFSERNCCDGTELEHARRERRILAWEAYTASKGCTLVERAWDVTHPDDLRDYAILRVNEEDALAAFMENHT